MSTEQKPTLDVKNMKLDASSLPPGYRKTALQIIEDFSVDLTNKNVLLTGATSGIGVETFRALAKAGANLLITARNSEKAASVVEDIKTTTGNSNIEVLECDFASLASVRKLVSTVLEKNIPIHILICNAGVMYFPTRSVTADGFEIQMGVNYLANFVLVNGLTPALKAANGARVVVVSSCAHLISDVNFDDFFLEKDYDTRNAYGASKSAVIHFSNEYNRRHSADNITANSLHPGGIMTGLQTNMTQTEMQALGWIDANGNVNPMFKTVEQGASTTVYVATCPSLEGKGGMYFEDCDISKPSVAFPMGYARWLYNQETESKLWQFTEQLLSKL